MSIKNITLAVAALGGLLASTSGSMAQAGYQSCQDAGTCNIRQTNQYTTNNHYNCYSEYGCRTPSRIERRQWGSEETLYFNRSGQ